MKRCRWPTGAPGSRPGECIEHIDYIGVARIYDLYAAVFHDVDFFTRHIRHGAHALELTAGSGRLWIPLIEAGVELPCVDISQGMLDVPRARLDDRQLQACRTAKNDPI